MKLPIPGTTFQRDVHSKAILQTDKRVIEENTMKRQMIERQQAEMNSLKAEMAEIKDLLRQLLSSKEKE